MDRAHHLLRMAGEMVCVVAPSVAGARHGEGALGGKADPLRPSAAKAEGKEGEKREEQAARVRHRKPPTRHGRSPLAARGRHRHHENHAPKSARRPMPSQITSVSNMKGSIRMTNQPIIMRV